MTDLELLNSIIGDLRLQLGNGQREPETGPGEIQDPAIRFFAEQLQPRAPAPAPDSSPIIDL